MDILSNILIYIIKLFISIVTILSSYFICHYFNISNYFSVIPVDKKIEVSVVIYTSILLTILEILMDMYRENEMKIELIAHEKKEYPVLNINPIYVLSETTQTSEINIYANIFGEIKDLNKIVLVLDLPSWIDAQLKNSYEENGSFKIKLKDIITTNRENGILTGKVIKLKIPIIFNFSNENAQSDEVTIKLENIGFIKSKLCKIEYNSFTIKKITN